MMTIFEKILITLSYTSVVISNLLPTSLAETILQWLR